MERAKSQKGQGIVEYILVTALVAIAAITMFKSFRSDVQEAYHKAGQALVQSVDDGIKTDSSHE